MARRPSTRQPRIDLTAIDHRLAEYWDDIKALLPGVPQQLVRSIVQEISRFKPGVVTKRTEIRKQRNLARKHARGLIAAITNLDDLLFPEFQRIAMPLVAPQQRLRSTPRVLY